MNWNICLECGDDLNALDLDPNGDKNCTCAKCRAEQEHDFDKEPTVRFTRGGNRIERRTDVQRQKSKRD